MRRRLAVAIALVCAGVLGACGSSSSPSSSGASTVKAVSSNAKAPGRPQSGPRQVERLVMPAHVVARTVRVPILTYHRVHLFATEFTKSIPDETVEPDRFKAEIDALAANGYHTVSQAQLFHALYNGASLPPKPVMITVDDGYVDDVQQILPVLKARNMVATFYIITGRFHEPGFLNVGEVRRLDDAGMDIGAHTRTHVPLNAIASSAMVNQIEGSKRDLQRILGHFVYFFAYPYGAYDAAVVQEVRRAGFLLAVTTNAGTQESSLAPLTMPRIHVGRTATPASVLACIRAGSGCGGGGG
jgi:peptidoglycan/xylan/chitin deacetylase (PgdA/CDA1 family)